MKVKLESLAAKKYENDRGLSYQKMGDCLQIYAPLLMEFGCYQG